MDACTRQYLDKPVAMKELGRLSLDAASPVPKAASGKRVAVIGGGPGGLSAAWHLRLAGHAVTVHEADREVGGKLRQVIPSERLPADVLGSEIARIKDLGVEIRTNAKVDAAGFEKIRGESDAVVIASGAHNPVVIPFPGHERLVKGLDFLKAINDGQRPAIGERVVVLGAGNAGMDVCLGAYAMGAKKVTAIDVQRPAAYKKEIDHVKALGGEVLWPVFTEKIDDKGLHAKDGRLLEADTVIIAIGERPDLSYVPRSWLTDRGMMEVDGCWQASSPGVFALGDAIKPGLLTHAIGAGREVAESIDAWLAGQPLVAKAKPEMIPQKCLSKELFRPQNRGRFCVTDAKDEKNRCLSCGTCRDCYMCLEACPEGAIRRVELADGKHQYVSDDHVCIGCGICAGICPCGIWQMELNVG
jgi:NADPH-dependent glutamate synthase beta subunit-like oxidoreductase/Pyruvate/2-oxoacid:ferredoxin oxidoreductase delta subunit